MKESAELAKNFSISNEEMEQLNVVSKMLMFEEVKEKLSVEQAIKVGLDAFGLNGFYEMHEEIINNQNDEWAFPLDALNTIGIAELDSIIKSMNLYGGM
jgi:hypothetical protein